MKRQKRNPSERAFIKGYMAGFEGKSRSLCPHETQKTRHDWLNGWREGRNDQWDGFNRQASMEKINNL
ncbi:ribosome modulation factor [Sessilibacter sp. MAH2]